MTTYPKKVDFDKIWSNLSEDISKIMNLTGVKGMPIIEYFFFLKKKKLILKKYL